MSGPIVVVTPIAPWSRVYVRLGKADARRSILGGVIGKELTHALGTKLKPGAACVDQCARSCRLGGSNEQGAVNMKTLNDRG